jgi:hypothetical protein
MSKGSSPPLLELHRSQWTEVKNLLRHYQMCGEGREKSPTPLFLYPPRKRQDHRKIIEKLIK